MLPARRRLEVSRVEAVGAYTLLVLRNEGGQVGSAGQFFMLQAAPEPAMAYLPRALSAAWAPRNCPRRRNDGANCVARPWPAGPDPQRPGNLQPALKSLGDRRPTLAA